MLCMTKFRTVKIKADVIKLRRAKEVVQSQTWPSGSDLQCTLKYHIAPGDKIYFWDDSVAYQTHNDIVSKNNHDYCVILTWENRFAEGDFTVAEILYFVGHTMISENSFRLWFSPIIEFLNNHPILLNAFEEGMSDAEGENELISAIDYG